MGELVSEAICCVTWSAAWLVRLLLVLLLHWLEVGATWAVVVLSIAGKVASWSLCIRILVLLLWSSLSLRRLLEDWLWEGRWGSWELPGIRWGGETAVLLVVEV